MAWKRSSVRSRPGPPIFQPRPPCTPEAYRSEFSANTFETYSVTAEIHGNDREKEPFDVSLINWALLCDHKTLAGPSPWCYFGEGATPTKCVEQNRGVTGVFWVQTQPVAQSALMLHEPPQVTLWASLRNWRAETVPAQRAKPMVVNSVVLAIFLNIVRLFRLKTWMFSRAPIRFGGGTVHASAVRTDRSPVRTPPGLKLTAGFKWMDVSIRRRRRGTEGKGNKPPADAFIFVGRQ